MKESRSSRSFDAAKADSSARVKQIQQIQTRPSDLHKI